MLPSVLKNLTPSSDQNMRTSLTIVIYQELFKSYDRFLITWCLNNDEYTETHIKPPTANTGFGTE